jgi:predicted component of type VI protein secretion system
MPIERAHLARSLGALGSLDVEQGLAVTLQQVLRSAKTLFDADGAGLMLVDQAGALRWASASNRVAAAVAGRLSVPVQVEARSGRWMSMSPSQESGTTQRRPPCRPMPGWSPACLLPR